ncbi:MAG: hypothetical protein DHS20C12_02620 [Pseudohongiella sp.]|nr:MAG: hypothetical protein DHS20C12_02620 [Pseudohongiella sp.]
MMSLWESYARRKISDKYSHIYPTSTKYEIGNVPIGGDKSMSISHWIEGRSSQDNLEEEFRLILNNPEILKSDAKLIDLQNLTCEIIGHYYLAMFESDILSQSSIPLTFPPKCHVYYNAWESLRIYYQLAFYFDQCGLDTPSSDYWKNSDKIKAFERKLQLKLRTTNRYVPFSLINYPHIRREAKMALTEFREVGKVSSPSYQHTIRDKYYLFDDFEDPLFKIEWTFVQVLATGSYLHLKEIEE